MKYKIGSNQFKKIPIYHNGKVISRFRADGRKYTFMQKIDMFMIKWIKRGAVVALLLGMGTGMFETGKNTTEPKVVRAEVIKEVPTMPDVPVLARIAKCESGGSQYDANGQVVLHANTNGTVDAGKYQINITVWGKTATSMGLNLMNEADNETFAQWLYLNKGTESWYSSKSCWSK